MFAFFIQGIGLGASAGAQPGPFQAYLISQSAEHGWRRAWVAAFAPLLSDGPIIALALLVLNLLPARTARALNLAGGLFILLLAGQAARAWRHFDQTVTANPQRGHHSLLRAALMNALNPNPYIYWSLVTGPILLRGWQNSPLWGAAFLGGFYLALIGINLAIIALAGTAAQAGAGFRRGVLGFSALALAAFGLFQLWRAAAG